MNKPNKINKIMIFICGLLCLYTSGLVLAAVHTTNDTDESNSACNCSLVNGPILDSSLLSRPSTDLRGDRSFLVPVKKHSWKLCIENYQGNLFCYAIPLDYRDLESTETESISPEPN